VCIFCKLQARFSFVPKTCPSATIQLNYKDKQREWKQGKSFGEVELEQLALAALEARKRIRAAKKAAAHPTPEAA
jgi:hypothetical protein